MSNKKEPKITAIYKVEERYIQVWRIDDYFVLSVPSNDVGDLKIHANRFADVTEYIAKNRKEAVLKLIDETALEQTTEALGCERKAVDELWRVIEFGIVKCGARGIDRFDWDETPQGARFWFAINNVNNPYENQDKTLTEGQAEELLTNWDKAAGLQLAQNCPDMPLVKPARSDGIHQVLEQRGNRYGEFKDGAKIMQVLKCAMQATPGWAKLEPHQKESLEMIQHKIGRILNGDPNYNDNWVDICGYSQLVVDELRKENETNDQV